MTDKEPGSRVPYYLERWRRGELGGFVVTDADYDDERVPWLRHAGVPFVMVGRLRETAGYCWVDNDNQTGSVMAVRHLVEHGHRRIAYLGWPGRDPVADRRLAGYRQGMRAAGLLELVEVQDYGQVALEQAHRLLAAPEGSRPTAVVASCDEFAYDAIRAGRELPIGGDPDSGLAVVGCDDSPLASRTTPSLTTLRQPVALLAERAAELLEARMADRRFEGHALEPPRLVVRESSRGGTSAPVAGAELPLGLRRPLGGSAIADEPPELGGIRMIADG